MSDNIVKPANGKVKLVDARCATCNKHIRVPEGETVGATCKKHAGKIRSTALQASAVPEGWIGMSKVCRKADDAGIGTRAVVKACGGDACTEPILDPVFQVTYVGARKFLNPEVLTIGFALLKGKAAEVPAPVAKAAQKDTKAAKMAEAVKQAVK